MCHHCPGQWERSTETPQFAACTALYVLCSKSARANRSAQRDVDVFVGGCSRPDAWDEDFVHNETVHAWACQILVNILHLLCDELGAT